MIAIRICRIKLTKKYSGPTKIKQKKNPKIIWKKDIMFLDKEYLISQMSPNILIHLVKLVTWGIVQDTDLLKCMW